MLKNPPAEADGRIKNLAKRDVVKLREPVECTWCKGTGKKSDSENDCYKCEGTGQIIGRICNSCDGYGEVEHECDCDICTEDMESCHCSNGVKYVAFTPENTLAAIELKTYWLQPV